MDREDLHQTPPVEPIIDPAIPIVDAHHHLWYLTDAVLRQMEDSGSISSRVLSSTYRGKRRYLLDELLHDFQSGHNVVASVFVDANAMYRVHGPKSLRSVGEIEFANGMGAMAASGSFGNIQACAGIVGGIDLLLGGAVEEILRAQAIAGGTRYRGIRATGTMYDADSDILGQGRRAHVLRESRFHEGLKRLQTRDLSCDFLLLEPQLPDLIHLARHFPDTRMVLNHLGMPVGIGRYSGRRHERFLIWRKNMSILATHDNVVVKLGGLGSPFAGFRAALGAPVPVTSVQLANEWKPYIETCIELFGPARCMFESNFPIDSFTAPYSVIWNSFKRIVTGATDREKALLFSETATRVYKLNKGSQAHLAPSS